MRQEGYRVRDERIAIAAEVKKLQDEELESRRRYIEHKQEVRTLQSRIKFLEEKDKASAKRSALHAIERWCVGSPYRGFTD